MEVARGRAYRRPLRVAEAILHVVDDRVLVDYGRDGLAELLVAEPLQLLGGEVALAGVGVHAGVHVESQERRAESGASLVYREVPFFLERFQLCEVLAQHAVGIRLTRQELGKLGLEVWHDDVNHFVQVRQAVARVVLEPVARVAPHDHALARNVPLDGKGAGADDLGRVRVDIPRRCEGAAVHVLLEDVLGLYKGPLQPVIRTLPGHPTTRRRSRSQG